jgi:hypothetical protein
MLSLLERGEFVVHVLTLFATAILNNNAMCYIGFYAKNAKESSQSLFWRFSFGFIYLVKL